MTDAEKIAQLQSLGRDLAGAEQSPWEPTCVARAFATPPAGALRFTMQAWIDLDALRSPILQFQPPTLDDLARVLTLLGATGEFTLTAAEAGEIAVRATEVVEAAFRMALPMTKPGAEKGTNHGFGYWLPVLARLIAEARCSLREALAMEVGQAFALLAALDYLDGCHPAGCTNYARRDVPTIHPSPLTDHPPAA